MTIFCTDCSYGKDCNTGKSYGGSLPPVEGTVTYGQPPVSQPFGAVPDPSSYPCMQAPATCTSVSFGCRGGAVNLDVTIARFQTGQIVTLPSPDVTVTASFDERYAGVPYDGGAYLEDLTLISGSLNVTVTLNNFDGYFNMTFARPNGGSLVIQNARVALLDAKWTENTTCY